MSYFKPRALGTPLAGTLTNCTGLPWSTGVSSKPALTNLITNSGFGVWSNGTLLEATSGAAPVDDGANAALVNNLLSNGAFDSATTDWSVSRGTIASIAGGKTGNCLEITRTEGDNQYALQVKTFETGKLYRVSGWVKSGTSGDEAYKIRIFKGDGVTYEDIDGTSSSSWVQFTKIIESVGATENGGSISLYKMTATAGTMLFDSITLYEVTPGCVAADALACDGMSKTSTLDIHREYGSAFISGLYGVKATKGADTAEYLNLSSRSDEAWYKQFRGRQVTIGCYIYSTTATDNVKLQINDSDGTTESSFVGADALTWIEVTRTCGSSITSFTPRVLFDGDTSDVAYVSKPMLIFGSSIGSGNYAPIPNEQILTEANITLTNYTATTSAADGIINLEAQSSGKIPKGAKAVLVKAYGKDSSAGDGVGFDVQSSSSVEDGISIDTQANNIRVQGQGWVKCNSNGDIYFNHRGSGASALTVDIKVIGVQI